MDSLFKYTRPEMDKVLEQISHKRAEMCKLRNLVREQSDAFWNHKVPFLFFFKHARHNLRGMFDEPIPTFLNVTHDESCHNNPDLDFLSDLDDYIWSNGEFALQCIRLFEDERISESFLTKRDVTKIDNTICMVEYMEKHGERLFNHMNSFDHVTAKYGVPLK